jgi:hypothetical protein
MEASVLDLRYRMRSVLGALNRRERIRLLYHGKVKGTIVPSSEKTSTKVSQHPFFGMLADDKRPVAEVMSQLRGGRYRDL